MFAEYGQEVFFRDKSQFDKKPHEGCALLFANARHLPQIVGGNQSFSNQALADVGITLHIGLLAKKIPGSAGGLRRGVNLGLSHNDLPNERHRRVQGSKLQGRRSLPALTSDALSPE